MIIKELNEFEPLELRDAFCREWDVTYNVPWLVIHHRVAMFLLTDGDIDKDIKNGNCEQEVPVTEYIFSSNEIYDMDIEWIKKRQIYLKDFSFAITCAFAEETSKNRSGYVYKLKDYVIYLKDVKDKRALNMAKKAIQDSVAHKDQSSCEMWLNTNKFLFNKANELDERIYKLTKKRSLYDIIK